MDWSPGIAAAAAGVGAAGVQAVTGLYNGNGSRDPLEHLFSAGSLSKHHVWNNANGCAYEYVRL